MIDVPQNFAPGHSDGLVRRELQGLGLVIPVDGASGEGLNRRAAKVADVGANNSCQTQTKDGRQVWTC